VGIAFTATFVYACVLCGFAMHQQRLSHQEVQLYASRYLPALDAVHVIREGVSALREDEANYLAATGPAEINERQGKLESDRARLSASLRDYEPLVSDPSERSLYEDALKQSAQYFAVQDRVLAEQHEAAGRLSMGESRQAFEALSETIGRWSEFRRNAYLEQSKTNEAADSHSEYILLALIGWIFINTVVAAVSITASVIRPLNEAVGMTRNVASGNLAKRVDMPGDNEIGALFSALNDMAARLSELVVGVRTSAETVRMTAGQLAERNAELSERTEQQAASVAATTASIGQIAVLGMGNSDSIRNVDKLADEARQLAEAATEIVAQAITEMNAINGGSNEISNIISVIDGIAFQTNLLALNAAVEAARAGEQGRGFAVVATEVRELSLRSASAAREIKALITSNGAQVRKGSELVDRSGQALSKISASIRQMTEMIGKIAISSRTQADDAQRINAVISKLDRSTQENASLVEEGAAAAEALREQADLLYTQFSSFRVESSPSQAAPRPARPERAEPERAVKRQLPGSAVPVAEKVSRYG
jgi:methyl-accepting chemotaxis protein